MIFDVAMDDLLCARNPTDSDSLSLSLSPFLSLSLSLSWLANRKKRKEKKRRTMADEQRKRRTFRKYSYRGVDLEDLIVMRGDELTVLFPARVRRRLTTRGLKRKHHALLKRLRKAKRLAPANEKPDAVKTHLRNMIILPEMIGSVIGVYNGKEFNHVEVKADMVGHYLAEFSITYKPVRHGKAGVGATKSSRFIPLK
jgi:small subunit ribosomal protein S15e